MLKPPLADGSKTLWIVSAELASFVPRPVVAAIDWSGSVLLTDGVLVSSSLKEIICDGTHIGASGDLSRLILQISSY